MLRNYTFNLPVVLLFFLFYPALGQQIKDSSAKQSDPFEQMINYSRPGNYHQLLADLVGSWTWKSKNFEGNADTDSNKVVREPGGTLTRKAFANGRFFIVELASGKGQTLQSPIQHGKMQEDNFRSMEIEAYDNVKNKFVKSFINNHIGSCIASYEGSYDSTTKTITYQTEVVMLPGLKWKLRSLLTFIDKDHYHIEDYMEIDGKFGKVGDSEFTRLKEK